MQHVMTVTAQDQKPAPNAIQDLIYQTTSASNAFQTALIAQVDRTAQNAPTGTTIMILLINARPSTVVLDIILINYQINANLAQLSAKNALPPPIVKFALPDIIMSSPTIPAI